MPRKKAKRKTTKRRTKRRTTRRRAKTPKFKTLRRGHYKVNRRRRGGRKFGLGMLPVDPMTVGLAAGGAVAVPWLLTRFRLADKLPGAPGSGTRLLVQAAVGAIAAGFLGNMLGKREWGKAAALGAAVVPVALLLSKQFKLAGLGQDYDEDFAHVEGAIYTAPEALGQDDEEELLEGLGAEDDEFMAIPADAY